MTFYKLYCVVCSGIVVVILCSVSYFSHFWILHFLFNFFVAFLHYFTPKALNDKSFFFFDFISIFCCKMSWRPSSHHPLSLIAYLQVTLVVCVLFCCFVSLSPSCTSSLLGCCLFVVCCILAGFFFVHLSYVWHCFVFWQLYNFVFVAGFCCHECFMLRCTQSL